MRSVRATAHRPRDTGIEYTYTTDEYGEPDAVESAPLRPRGAAARVLRRRDQPRGSAEGKRAAAGEP
jgi:hypothetical protein